MASPISVTTGYKGVLAGEILAQAFKKAETFNKDLITMIPNVIGSGWLPSLGYSAALQPYACGWTPVDAFTYLEKEVPLKKFMIQHEICKDKFYQTFQAVEQGLWAADNDIPTDIMSAILDSIIGNVASAVDDMIWNGTNTASTILGIIPQLLADTAEIIYPTANYNSIDAVAITQANVLTEIQKVIDGLPCSIIDMDDLVFVMSRNVYSAYKLAVASQGFNVTSGVDYSNLDYLGLRIEMLCVLPSDTMLVYEKKNVGFLTGLLSDLNEVRVSDDEDRLDGMIRTKVTFTAAASYTDRTRIMLYTPAVTP